MVFVFVLIILHSLNLSNHRYSEPFIIEQDVTYSQTNTYHVKHPEFQKLCSRSLVRPTDVYYTNVYDFFSNSDNTFIGIASSKKQYFILTRKNSKTVRFVSEIPTSSIIAYSNESDLHILKRMLTKIYQKKENAFKYTKLAGQYVNNHCDTVDISNNCFVDFLESEANYFIVGMNTVFEKNMINHYDTFFQDTRCVALQIHSAQNTKQVVDRMNLYLFNHVLENNNCVKMDELVITKNKEPYDVDKLNHNGYIDFDTTQIYVDLYQCTIPPEISSRMTKLNALKKTIQNTKGSSDSCLEDTLIKKNDSSSTNSFYTEYCDAEKHSFIDITYPFITDDFDITISSLDFTELIIRSTTFDDMIPISNAVTKNNNTIPRYKINVDPIEYPNEAFINDIYYGAFLDITGEYTVLTNAIPFTLSEDKHVVIAFDNFYQIKQKNDENTDFIVTYDSPQGESVSVKLEKGDRIFINPDTIFDTEMDKFIIQKLRDDKNMLHGNVDVDTDSKLFIQLHDIRKTFDIDTLPSTTTIGSCFDENWERMQDGPSNKDTCEANSKNTWDVPCRYNSECPYFRSNLNYKNFLGGCLPGGFCEMPVGITERAYRTHKASDDNKPICYNCNAVSDEDCCEVVNSNLESPDFMFEYDTVGRIQELYTFKDKDCNLMVNKYV